jgi:hypothetical protein
MIYCLIFPSIPADRHRRMTDPKGGHPMLSNKAAGDFHPATALHIGVKRASAS